jgi:hypothetical protein
MSFRRVRGRHPGERPPRTPKPSSAERRKSARAAIGDDIGFAFGFFFVAMPVSAIGIGFACVLTGIVTLFEALVAVAVTSGWVALAVFGKRAAPVAGWFIDAVVGGVTRFVLELTPVPVVGRIAEFIGMTMVLWLPAVILAVVRFVSRI